MLATAVIVHHFIVSYCWHVTGNWETTDSRVLNNMGTVPVSLFFMITGYLFASKIYRSEPKWLQIFASRLRRIFLMYLFSVALITAIALYKSAGISAPLFEDRVRQWRIDFSGVRCTLVAIAVLLICMTLKSYSTLQMLTLGIPFALFVLGNNLNGVLNIRGLRILGEASFSIYLLHGIVIYSVFSLINVYDFAGSAPVTYLFYLPLVILLTSSISVATYWCIEHPFLRAKQSASVPNRRTVPAPR